MPDDLVEQIDEELQTDIQQNKDFNPERPTRPSSSGRLQTDIQQNKDSNSKPCRASPGRPLVAAPLH